jgi:hypothetical protein
MPGELEYFLCKRRMRFDFSREPLENVKSCPSQLSKVTVTDQNSAPIQSAWIISEGYWRCARWCDFDGWPLAASLAGDQFLPPGTSRAKRGSSCSSHTAFDNDMSWQVGPLVQIERRRSA